MARRGDGRITRRALEQALAGCAGALFAPTARGDEPVSGWSLDLSLFDLKWTGTRPTFPLFRATASGAFKGEVDVRIATRSDPMRYRPSLAFYRLSVALACKVVPRTEVHAVRLSDLLAALRKDPVGLSLLRDEMAVLNDGTVTVLVSEPVPNGRDVDFWNGAESHAWRTFAEGRQPVPRDRRALISDFVETLVLDYLAANTQRTVVTVGAESASIRLLDNGRAFAERPDVAALDRVLAELKRVSRFPKRVVDALRSFDRPVAESALRGGSFVHWLVASRPLVEMFERRGALLSLIDARVAELGEPAVLALP